MSKFIQNKRYKNHKVSFQGGILLFNEEGIAEVADEHVDSLTSLKGYAVVDEEFSEGDDSETEKSATEEETLRERLGIMTVKQLLRYATSENIDLGTASKKEDIIEVIVESKESK